MLPPTRRGGTTLWRPGSAGATPMTPQNGSSGTEIPGRNAARPPSNVHRWSHGSGNSSARSPKPGIWAVQPKSPGTISRRSTWRTSPGRAPSTKIGPETGLTRSKSSVRTVSSVAPGRICPAEASWVSMTTSCPLRTVCEGSKLRSQPNRTWSRTTWMVGDDTATSLTGQVRVVGGVWQERAAGVQRVGRRRRAHRPDSSLTDGVPAGRCG